MQTTEFITMLPKAELHLHLEGALPWEMVRAYATEPLPDRPAWWEEDFLFDDFTDFQAVMRLCYNQILTSVDNYHQAAGYIFRNLAEQNVRYVEISFGAGILLRQELDFPEVIAAIKAAAPPDMTVIVYGGLARNQTLPLSDPLIESVLNATNLDGLDLHGDERLGQPAPFADIFAQARLRGLETRAHAGELTGPQTISDTLDYLQVNRIEHGTSAIHDEALMTRLANERVTLDMCPTSNLKLQAVSSLTEHPIRTFHQRGIPVTVNSDDPTAFGSSLTDELHLLVDQLDFTLADLAQLQINAFQVAKMPEDKRAAMLAEIEQLVTQLNPAQPIAK